MKLLTPMLFSVATILLTGACSQSPLTPFHKYANLRLETAQGDRFIHQTALKERAGNQTHDTLHVYIEGDGRPWWRRYEIAHDPTPKKLPMLSLMSMDNQEALYLGRPCYFGLNDPTCEAYWWTHGRYSESVVASMNAVLDQYAGSYNTIRLFGHSGGGALAMLLAARRDDVEAVVTLAGNLDIEAWATYHRYSPLTGSLNPIDFKLSGDTRQFHFVGSDDKAIPAWLVEQSADKLGSAKVSIIDGIDHSCCWQGLWKDIIESLD